jgi:hypothetical protein
MNLNITEVIKRAIKYFLEAIAVILAARYIPKYKMDLPEILLIGAIAAISFAILDMYAPTVAQGARLGTGARIGWNLVQ